MFVGGGVKVKETTKRGRKKKKERNQSTGNAAPEFMSKVVLQN